MLPALLFLFAVTSSFSEEASLPKPDGIIPIFIYDSEHNAAISESALLERLHQACSLLQEDPQGYSEYLRAFFRDYQDVPRDYKKSFLHGINQCGTKLKSHFNSQSPWEFTDTPAISPVFSASWSWIVPGAKGFRKDTKKTHPARTKPEKPVAVAHSPAGSQQAKSQALAKSFEGQRGVSSPLALPSPSRGEGRGEGGKSPPPIAYPGFRLGREDFCKGDTCHYLFGDDLVEGQRLIPDGEHISSLVLVEDKCSKQLKRSIDEIASSRQRSGLAMTDEHGEPWDDPQERRVLMDQYLNCVDPCLTDQERAVLLDDNCSKDCVNNSKDAYRFALCKRCWAKLGVRSERAATNPSTGTRDCLAYVKPVLPDLPPKPKPFFFILNHILSPKEISEKSDKIVKLAELPKATGGQVSEVKAPQDTSDAIKARLTLLTPQKHYQALFLIDVSSSMQAHVEDLKSKVPELIAYAKTQLKNQGQVTFAVRYYVDTTSERPVPLDSGQVLQQRANEQKPGGENNKYTQQEANQAIQGLSQAITFINNTGGSLEYHWEETVKAVEQEPWSPSPDTEKVIFLITDECGDIGAKRYTEKDAISKTKAKNIRYEVIMYQTGYGGCGVSTSQYQPTLKTYTVTVDYSLPLDTPAQEQQEQGLLKSVKSWFKSDKPNSPPIKSSAIAVGAYNYANPNINSKNFPDSEAKKPYTNQKSQVPTQIALFDFVGDITKYEVIERMSSLGYRPANLYELLALGAKEKDLQRQFPIVSLGSSFLAPRGLYVPYLSWVGSKRGSLGLYWVGFEWGPGWQFAAVRK